MPRRRSNEWRVLGPEKHGRRWRVFVIPPGGTRRDSTTFETRTYDSEAAALKFKREILEELGGAVSIDRALDQYERHQRGAGLEAVTVETTMYRLGLYFDGARDLLLMDLDEQRGKALYTALRDRRKKVWTNPLAPEPPDAPRIAIQTQRHALSAAKTFARWCVDEGLMRASPLEKVKPVGKPKRMKKQLTIDQGRQLVAVCLRELAAGDAVALAVIIGVVFGIRSSAIAALTVDDIDDRGRVLIVRKSKTDASLWLRLAIPVELQPVIAAYIDGRIGRLFPRRNEKRARDWLLYHTKRLCWLAGVPEVTTHGLRGTQASTSVESGATAEMVMRQLGQAGTEVGRRHYIRPGAAESARARAAAAALLPAAGEGEE